jgi:hypothetical protein
VDQPIWPRRTRRQLFDGDRRDVETDQVEPSPDQWEVVPPVTAPDVEAEAVGDDATTGRSLDVIDEGEWGFGTVSSPRVLTVPRCTDQLSGRHLGSLATASDPVAFLSDDATTTVCPVGERPANSERT